MKKPKGGIRLDDLEAIREKSQTDNLVLPHKASKSTLVKSISLKPGETKRWTYTYDFYGPGEKP